MGLEDSSACSLDSKFWLNHSRWDTLSLMVLNAPSIILCSSNTLAKTDATSDGSCTVCCCFTNSPYGG